MLFSSVAVVGLERLYVSAREGARRAEVCAIVEDEGSASFQFYVRFMFIADTASRCSFIALITGPSPMFITLCLCHSQHTLMTSIQIRQE